MNIKGTLILKGKGMHSFAPGAIIYVGKNAILEIDEGFSASHDLKLYCRYRISIGKDNMWSYYNIVMDNDGHHICDANGVHINDNREVIFGNHVWLACRCIVLKGSKIANGSIIGSGSLVRKGTPEENAAYAGNGPELKKRNVFWNRKLS